jgi:three-Cys-motif partner protein
MKKGIIPRPPQTKVKHLILDKYLEAWGSIIIHGLKSQPTILHFVYIDCNASYGRYAGELDDKITQRGVQNVFGSPIIGVNRLDLLANWARGSYGKEVRTSSILIEKDPKIFNELKQSLSMAGLDHRAKETDNFSTLKDGEIAILCGDSTLLASKLVDYTQSGSKFSFFLLDPYGPTGIPISFVSEIIRQNRHDVIINMPYQDLHKKRIELDIS